MLDTASWLVVMGAAAASALAGGPPPTGTPAEEAWLGDQVAAVLRADYRGEREELRRRAEALAAGAPGAHAAWRAYWAGFAWWRRGMNGYNETPLPADVFTDFERCAEMERSALALDPSLEDARSALSGCLVGLSYLAVTQAPERRAALFQEAIDTVRAVEARAEGNPRSLWIVGGKLMSAPPGRGGDREQAAATYRRGLEAARAEALGPPRPPWVPSWGAPELLMSLAFLHATGPAPDRALALAYADGALALVPDWHFVRDVLVPRIEKLPAGPAAPAPGGPSR